MRAIFIASFIFLACSNPVGLGGSCIPDGLWTGIDARCLPVSVSCEICVVSELSWVSVLDTTSMQYFDAPPLPLRPHISFDTTSAFGNAVHIEADWMAEDSTWTGWHRVDDQAVVSFTLTRT